MAVDSSFLYISLKCKHDGIYPTTQYCFASLKIIIGTQSYSSAFKIQHCESGFHELKMWHERTPFLHPAQPGV